MEPDQTKTAGIPGETRVGRGLTGEHVGSIHTRGVDPLQLPAGGPCHGEDRDTNTSCATAISLTQCLFPSMLLRFGAKSFFVVGGCLVHCKPFTNIPSLYPNCDNQKCLQTFAKCSLGLGAELPLVET